MNRLRWALGALGVLAALYGGWLVLSRQDGPARLESVVLWLAGGAVLHDLVLAPVVIGLAWAARGLPRPWRSAVVVAVVVLGSLTLLAVPVLSGLGERTENPTLLDRPYGWSWVALAAVTALLVVVAGLVGSRRAAPAAAVGTPVTSDPPVPTEAPLAVDPGIRTQVGTQPGTETGPAAAANGGEDGQRPGGR